MKILNTSDNIVVKLGKILIGKIYSWTPSNKKYKKIYELNSTCYEISDKLVSEIKNGEKDNGIGKGS